MKVLITGANGFIAKNLIVHLAERKDVEVVTFTRQNNLTELTTLVESADFIFHLAGVNRSEVEIEFAEGNTDLSQSLCNAIEATGRKIPVIYSSSIQAELNNPYGISKLRAEEVLKSFSKTTGTEVYIFRLPNVFGKWSRPNYNSAVATFCNNIAKDLPIQINNSSAEIRLVYVDDVVKQFISIMNGNARSEIFCHVDPIYEITVGDLAKKITAYKQSRETLVTEDVGSGFDRALHSTYLSYIQPEQFSYTLTKHGDERGVFVEMLKTRNSGQFSFFTAHPGITRGGHYHHTKTEKFLVVRGEALFKFRHIVLGEYYELKTTAGNPTIVETIPGWTHDITNIGNDEMIVMLWANETFDRENPDTYAQPL
jgi:UDP-2-acetamido-2,6-beta-L-arabino-hexul-4-ose reductase